MLSDFYRGKRVFITGHTGFKGSWLSIWLEYMGAEIFGYSLEPEDTVAMHYLCQLNSRTKGIYADIRDKVKLENCIEAFKPDIIFHMAAQPLVLDSYKNPLETFEVNVMGTINLLEVIKRNDRPLVLVNVTTDKCYENAESFWGYRENDSLGGNDPYSASKACSEIATQAYSSSFFSEENKGIKVATARAGNVIGGGDFSQNRICPDIAKAIIDGKEIRLRNPYALRPWQHVLDALMGYLLLAMNLYESNMYKGAWNFGPSENHEMTVLDLTREMIKVWGADTTVVVGSDLNKKETQVLKLDTYKSRTLLGYYSPWSISEAIRMTVEWYRTYGDTSRPLYDVSIEQIEEYTSRLKSMEYLK